jgi:hypothetical protein
MAALTTAVIDRVDVKKTRSLAERNTGGWERINTD